MFPLCLLSGGFFFFHKWMLNFLKGFLCIYWANHMVFIFQFVNVVYHIDWFANIKESLHPWDKAYLVMMYDLFNVVGFCLLEFCWGFLHLCSSVILACIFLFFFVASLSGFCIRVMVASQNEFGSLPSSMIFWKSLSRIGVSSSVNFW